jgi:hypothetical protein
MTWGNFGTSGTERGTSGTSGTESYGTKREISQQSTFLNKWADLRVLWLLAWHTMSRSAGWTSNAPFSRIPIAAPIWEVSKPTAHKRVSEALRPRSDRVFSGMGNLSIRSAGIAPGRRQRRSRAHRLDEFPAGYSSANYSPAGSASASPTVDHFASNGQQCLNCLSQLRGPPQLIIGLRDRALIGLMVFSCRVRE